MHQDTMHHSHPPFVNYFHVMEHLVMFLTLRTTSTITLAFHFPDSRSASERPGVSLSFLTLKTFPRLLPWRRMASILADVCLVSNVVLRSNVDLTWPFSLWGEIPMKIRLSKPLPEHTSFCEKSHGGLGVWLFPEGIVIWCVSKYLQK